MIKVFVCQVAIVRQPAVQAISGLEKYGSPRVFRYPILNSYSTNGYGRQEVSYHLTLV